MDTIKAKKSYKSGGSMQVSVSFLVGHLPIVVERQKHIECWFEGSGVQ